MGWLSHIPRNHEPREARVLIINDYWGYYKGTKWEAQVEWFCLDCAHQIRRRRRARDKVVFRFVDKPIGQVLLL